MAYTPRNNSQLIHVMSDGSWLSDPFIAYARQPTYSIGNGSSGGSNGGLAGEFPQPDMYPTVEQYDQIQLARNLIGDHEYFGLDRVSDLTVSADEVFECLKQHAAPGQIGPSYDGKVVDIPLLGSVEQYVDQAGLTVTNVTLPGHLLHPGTVNRSVVWTDQSYFIQTHGVGSGLAPRLNEWYSGTLWEDVNDKIETCLRGSHD